MNSVFCCFFLGKIDKMFPNPGLVNKFSATPWGQLNWTGPIANSSDHFTGMKIHPLDSEGVCLMKCRESRCPISHRRLPFGPLLQPKHEKNADEPLLSQTQTYRSLLLALFDLSNSWFFPTLICSQQQPSSFRGSSATRQKWTRPTLNFDWSLV